MSFLFRQIYRVVVVWPWQFFATVVALFWKKEYQVNGQPYVIITSVLSPVKKSLSYTTTRSVFTKKDRLAQTLDTITSVRRAVPHATIILAEGGKEAVDEVLRQAADIVIHVGAHWFVRCCVDSRLKSLGEIVMLLSLYTSLPRRAVWYYKVSGRYTLVPETSLPHWKGRGLHGKFLRERYLSTRVYGFPGEELWRWRRTLIRSLPFAFLDYPVEALLPMYWTGSPIVHYDTLGIQGRDATNGQTVID